MFDTHCHLNFKAFDGRVEEVITSAKKVGVSYFVAPGTDIETSKKAIEIAEEFEGVYAAVGIHPHHLFKLKVKSQKLKVEKELEEIKKLLNHPKVVAVGEIGLDRYIYKKTKYKNYQVDEEFINLQKQFFIEQLKLVRKFKKAVIIHNRLATDDLLNILSNIKYLISNIKIVFHCCQSDDQLLDFAKKHKIFIGVDGDVTYDKKKQEFVKKIPLDLLVLETDSPFLTPVVSSLIRSSKNTTLRKFPNKPKNLPLIAQFISQILNVSMNQLIEVTRENARRLFLGINS